MVDAEELAKCFDADQLRGYSPIRSFTREERRVIAAALRELRATPPHPAAPQAGTAQSECTSPNEKLALDVLERLQTICERHGCEPGTNRLDWIEEMLGRSQAMREALELARAFIDPDANPPRISNREMVQKIDAALQSSQPEAGEKSDGAIYAEVSQRNMTADEKAGIERALRDSGTVLYDLSPSSSGQRGCEEWLPMGASPRGGEPVLLKFKDQIPSEREDLRKWEGLAFVGRFHGPVMDWGFAAPVGMGGFPDEWLEGWRPLPSSRYPGATETEGGR